MKSIVTLAMTLSILPMIGFSVVALPARPSFAGTVEEPRLLEARKLSSQGEFAQVIRVLEPLAHSSPDTLDDVSRGVAWNLLGPAYEALGNFEAARRSYETAIQLLRTHPAARSDYASALNSLGALETYMGQLDAAKVLLRKAKGLYAGAGDHVGLAEVAINSAIVALDRNDTHRARNFLSDAFREAERTKDVTDSNRAAMYTIKGNLAARDHDFAAAVLDYQQSIDFWTRARGPKYYLIALEYAMLADAYRELGDYNNARSDITAAIRLLEETVGRNTGMYAMTELANARLLRSTGANAEAAQIETEAKALLKGMRNEQCTNCSISSAGFR